MQTEQTENELIIRETPGCLWIVGLFFALAGGTFVYGALGGFSNWRDQSLWTLVVAFLMGSIAVAAGIWIIYGAPITKVIIDRVEDTVRMTRYGLFGKRESYYDFAEIERFYLVEEKDTEGDDIWFLGMELTDGETIKISSFASHDERFKSNFVFQTNEFTRKQIPSSQMILDSEDEDDAEIS